MFNAPTKRFPKITIIVAFGIAVLAYRKKLNDFDWGVDAIIDNSNRSYNGYKVPTLGANIYDFDFDSKTTGNQRNDFAKEYVIKTLPNGLKVGIVGVIGESQITSICTKFAKDFTFKNHIQAIKDVSDYLRTEKQCDLIIGSEHDGYDSEENALAQVSPVSHKKYVDFVFNAHTHYNEVYSSNGVYFAQCGANGNAIGHATLTYNFNTGSVSTDYETLDAYDVQSVVYSIGIDSGVSSIIDSYAEVSNPIGSEVLSTKFTGTFSKTENLPKIYEDIYKISNLKYEIEMFNNDGSCKIMYIRDN